MARTFFKCQQAIRPYIIIFGQVKPDGGFLQAPKRRNLRVPTVVPLALQKLRREPTGFFSLRLGFVASPQEAPFVCLLMLVLVLVVSVSAIFDGESARVLYRLW